MKIGDRNVQTSRPRENRPQDEVRTAPAEAKNEIKDRSREDRGRGTRPLDPGDLAFLPDRGKRSAMRLSASSGSRGERTESGDDARRGNPGKKVGQLSESFRGGQKSAESRLLSAFKGDPEIQARIRSLNLSKRDSTGGRLGDTLVKMLDSNPKMPGYPDGKALAAEVIGDIARPAQISQGVGTTTCTTASLQTIMAKSQRAEYARVAFDLATRQEATLQGGATISAGNGDFKAGEKRTALSDAFQMGLYRLATSQSGAGSGAGKDFGLLGARAGKSSFAGVSAFTRKSSYAGDTARGLDIQQYSYISEQALGRKKVNVRATRETLAQMRDRNELDQTVFLRAEAKGQSGHAVTLVRWEGATAVLADPARGMIRLSLDELATRAAFITSSTAETSTSLNRMKDVISADVNRLATIRRLSG